MNEINAIVGDTLYEINSIPLNKLFYTANMRDSNNNYSGFIKVYDKLNTVEENDFPNKYSNNNVDLLLNKCSYFTEYYSGENTVSNLSGYNKLSFFVVAGGGGAGGSTSSASGSSGGGGNMYRFNTIYGKPVSSFTYRIGSGGTGGTNGGKGGNGGNSTLSVTFTDSTIFNVTVYGGNGGDGNGGSGGTNSGISTTTIGNMNVESETNYLGSTGGNGRGSGGSYQASQPYHVMSGFFVNSITLNNMPVITNIVSNNPNISYSTAIGCGGYGIRKLANLDGINGGDGYIRCYFA
jgi:hypothetical protein